jgi:dTDP-4-amino-4,6-dideoxygalactose transaminase
MEQRYANEIVGANMRMTDVAAAIGRVQLGRLPEWTERRRTNAKTLDSLLDGVRTPQVADGAEHVYHQYTVRVPGGHRDVLAERLQERGIGCAVYYPTPIHRLRPYNDPARPPLPETDRACEAVLSLPVPPGVGEGELRRIAAAVNEVMAELGSGETADPETAR